MCSMLGLRRQLYSQNMNNGSFQMCLLNTGSDQFLYYILKSTIINAVKRSNFAYLLSVRFRKQLTCFCCNCILCIAANPMCQPSSFYLVMQHLTNRRDLLLNSSPRKMSTISQMRFSNAFVRIKSFVLWLEFHWILLLGIIFTINQNWFR